LLPRGPLASRTWPSPSIIVTPALTSCSQRIASNVIDPVCPMMTRRLSPLVALGNRPSRLPTGEHRDAALDYLVPRLPHLQYPTFRAAGYPIGSGIVESANKVVVADRLKGSGMHWAPQHVDPLLALRTIVCADRWEEAWPRISARLRAEDHARRQQRRQRCAERRAARTATQIVAATPISDSALPPAAPLPASPPRRFIDGRPTKAHPWNRRFLPLRPGPPAEN